MCVTGMLVLLLFHFAPFRIKYPIRDRMYRIVRLHV